MPEDIKWRIKFLAYALRDLHSPDAMEAFEEDESCGLMCFLHDIADMICPPDEKGGVA
jgi:hypothetical protein